MPFSTPVKVLDSGCGTGIVLEVLREKVFEEHGKAIAVTCADLSEKMVQNTEELIRSRGWSNDNAVVADMQVCQLLATPACDDSDR